MSNWQKLPPAQTGRLIGLILVLVVFWLALSGLLKPVILGFGLMSIALVMWLLFRLAKSLGEGSWVRQIPGVLLYLPWLAWEIVKSNLEVARLILSPAHALSPTIFWLKPQPESDFGKALLANSITLTPGTVTLDYDPEEGLLIHALTRDFAAGTEDGVINQKVAAIGKGIIP